MWGRETADKKKEGHGIDVGGLREKREFRRKKETWVKKKKEL